MAVALKPGEGVLLAHYVVIVCGFMQRRGFSAEETLASTRLSLDTMKAEPNLLVSLPALLQLLDNIHRLDPSPTLSFELGAQLNLGSHGFLGYAFLASPTLESALSLVNQYAQTRSQLLHFTFFTEADMAVMEISDHGLLGHWFPTIFEAMCASIFAIAGNILPSVPIDRSYLCLSFAEAPQHQILHALLKERVSFNCARTQIRFPVELLQQALGTADAQLAALAAAQCAEELKKSEGTGDFRFKVMQLARQHLTNPQSQEAVAAALNITTRTLHRHLQEYGVNYKDIIDGLRRDSATYQLSHSSSPISTLAIELGYSDASNFIRAFKRWTGQTPQQFRDAH